MFHSDSLIIPFGIIIYETKWYYVKSKTAEPYLGHGARCASTAQIIELSQEYMLPKPNFFQHVSFCHVKIAVSADHKTVSAGQKTPMILRC
jgi:hypothetical protein